ncbi:single-stranded DNA-binding protein [Clavibacter zhangzhiyongii]|uniref:single-stranded DNA-binding protein n=1 Tax=Clavibacter zhangzhiyongii TaxID=2768071 RepID=UPI001957809B|nr:single-stranded DNA-binding protein [Clavibacter zhangzhiyongii]MBM7024509.1 single-stranded DNA-binding protein [Clavibacter zhangzhiyongii]
MGRLTRAELEERRRAAPLPPQITPEQALASWGLDVEPLPESERPPEPPQTAPSGTTYMNRRSIMSTRVIIGNLAADPEAVAAGQVTITKFRLMENTGEYRKGEWVKHETPTAHFVEAKFQLGEHTLATLRKGDRVILVGREHTRSWEKKEGGTGYGRVVVAEAVGPDLSYTTAVVNRDAAPSHAVATNPWVTE